MLQAILLLVHTNPNGIGRLHVIKMHLCKIPFLLGRNQAADIKDRPVNDVVSGWLILLRLHIDNHLFQAIPHPHIKEYIKVNDTLVELGILCIQADNLLAFFVVPDSKTHRPFRGTVTAGNLFRSGYGNLILHSLQGIRQSRFQRRLSDDRVPFNQRHNLIYRHALKFLHCINQYTGKNFLVSQKFLRCLIILNLRLVHCYRICKFCFQTFRLLCMRSTYGHIATELLCPHYTPT